MADDPYTAAAADAETGPVSGIFKSLTRLLATVIGIVQTRVELLTTELQEEIQRAAEIMVWAVVALLAAGIGLFLAALAVIFVFWDTHRVLASVAMTSAFFIIAVVAGTVLFVKIRTKPRLLDATLRELAKDRDHLQKRL